MADDPRTQERRGTRRLIVWAAAIAAILLVALSVWPLLPGREATAPQQTTDSTGIRSNQGAGESAAAKRDPNGPEDPTGGKARDIQESARDLALTDTQRAQMRDYFAKQNGNRADRVDFTLSIGSAVPQQVELQKLPSDISEIMGGYQGDDYLLVRDQLVIVDSQARRVVAIVPGMS